MDSEPDASLALLSIHPEYVELMATGKKKVEFRRTRFLRHLTHIVVYSTSPEKRLAGYFEVERIDIASPQSISSKHKEDGGISHERLSRYMKDANYAVAILMGDFHPFKKNLSLDDIGVLYPPQSFRYLDTSVLDTLQAHV